MARRITEDYDWTLKAEDLNDMNDVAVFMGPIMTMYDVVAGERLKKIMKSPERFALIDVRSGADYKASHVCGAMNAPVVNIERDAGRLFFDVDARIIICGNGVRDALSAVAADKLFNLGYENVSRLECTVDEWIKSGGCAESGASSVKEASAPPTGEGIKRAA